MLFSFTLTIHFPRQVTVFRFPSPPTIFFFPPFVDPPKWPGSTDSKHALLFQLLLAAFLDPAAPCRFPQAGSFPLSLPCSLPSAKVQSRSVSCSPFNEKRLSSCRQLTPFLLSGTLKVHLRSGHACPARPLYSAMSAFVVVWLSPRMFIFFLPPFLYALFYNSSLATVGRVGSYLLFLSAVDTLPYRDHWLCGKLLALCIPFPPKALSFSLAIP